MPDTKVSATTNASALAGGEEWHGVQSAADVAISADQMKTYALTTPLAVVGNATAGAELRLPEDTDNGAHYVALKAPDSLAATYTLTFPADDGSSGEFLSTNGSGTLSWAAAGGGASAPLTLASGTLTDPSTALTVTQTWNDATDTFTAAVINVTETASAVGSKLLDLQEAGTSVVSVARNTTGGNHAGEWRLVFGADISIGFASAYGALTVRNAANSSDAGIFCKSVDLVNGGSFNTDWGGAGLNLSTTAWRDVWEVIGLGSNCGMSWSSTTSATGTKDCGFARAAAGVVGVRGANNTTGGALNFIEQTAPSAPASNQAVIYAEDNGSGKTRLMALFPTGAAQQIAIEP